MSRPNATPFRLCIVHNLSGKNTKSYIVRKDNGQVIYISGTEQPLSLSNLFGEDAAEARFELQDCADADAALELVESRMDELWGDKNPHRPRVDVM